jgi:hypothetical protein
MRFVQKIKLRRTNQLNHTSTNQSNSQPTSQPANQQDKQINNQPTYQNRNHKKRQQQQTIQTIDQSNHLLPKPANCLPLAVFIRYISFNSSPFSRA